VIYATGYRISFPFLENVFPVTKSNDVRLYKYVVSTDPKMKNLFFIGLVQVMEISLKILWILVPIIREKFCAFFGYEFVMENSLKILN
jgi:hypothetical protein